MVEYLYVIERLDGQFKFGRSTDVGKRLTRLFYGEG